MENPSRRTPLSSPSPSIQGAQAPAIQGAQAPAIQGAQAPAIQGAQAPGAASTNPLISPQLSTAQLTSAPPPSGKASSGKSAFGRYSSGRQSLKSKDFNSSPVGRLKSLWRIFRKNGSQTSSDQAIYSKAQVTKPEPVVPHIPPLSVTPHPSAIEPEAMHAAAAGLQHVDSEGLESEHLAPEFDAKKAADFKASEALQRFVEIIRKLRDPKEGCPWDLEQTHQSLKPYIIEEAHEVVDAIDAGLDSLPDELGDVLLQVVLHCQIAAEAKRFDLAEVIERVAEKMVRRHPHVFGEVKVSGTQQVLTNWETIKQSELAAGKSIVDGIPRSMPALLRAQRAGDKASRVGFDWIDATSVLDKVQEELLEFTAAVRSKEPEERQQEELGDLLFSLAQHARKQSWNIEALLQSANDKFIRRFKELEKLASKPLTDLDTVALEQLWESVKSAETKTIELESGLNGDVPMIKETPMRPLKKVSEPTPASFEYSAPDAHSVCVAGSFNEWDTASHPLTREDTGIWRLTLKLAPGRYEYRYVVDGHWQNDQRPVECIASQHGSLNCVITVESPS